MNYTTPGNIYKSFNGAGGFMILISNSSVTAK